MVVANPDYYQYLPGAITNNGAWGGGDQNNSNVQQVNSAVEMFMQQYKNLTGVAPTGQQIHDFAQNALAGAWGAPGDLTYSDNSNLANNYIQNSAGPQIAQHQQQQQSDQLGKTQQTIKDLVQQQTAASAADLTNPTGPTYQAFSGALNNLGITPSSGAFQAGLGGTLGQNASRSINSALGAVSLPAISGIQGMNQIPYQFAQGNSDLSHLNQVSDFGMEAELAKILASQGQMSGTQQILGNTFAGLNAGGNAAGGVGKLISALGSGGSGGSGGSQTSYVCMELIKRGLLCESDMDDFHVHIMPAMFKKGRAFWKYAMDGWRLVNAVNAKSLDWKAFKTLLFDRVMEEADPCKAVDLYADACHQLCISSDRSLWDKRVYRTSFWDSLIFLPRLLVYRPFMEALFKCVRIKMLFIYDKPRCVVHR